MMHEGVSWAVEVARFRTGHDALDATQLSTTTFWNREQGTLLGRLYNHWIDSAGTIGDTFCPPSLGAFDPDRITNGHEKRFVASVRLDCPDFAKSVEEMDEFVVGRRNPFNSFTVSSVFQCMARREPLYFLLHLELGQLSQKFYRLLLPSVDKDDKVSKVDLAHRFPSEPFQLIKDDPFSWAP